MRISFSPNFCRYFCHRIVAKLRILSSIDVYLSASGLEGGDNTRSFRMVLNGDLNGEGEGGKKAGGSREPEMT